MADAFNNLSDSFSSIITILGFKLSNKPADKEHPYGHARYEQLTAILISFIILAMGVLLAKSLLLSFTDTDLLIQGKHKKSLCDIIKDNGTKAFLDIEENIILEAEFKNSVIATGGSAVFGEKAMKKLKEKKCKTRT